MAMTPEGKVKKEVIKILKAHGAYYFCPVQNGFGAPGLDFHCVHHGLGFFIETKAKGKKPTPRQNLTIQRVQESSGMVFVIDGTDNTDTYAQLDAFLTTADDMAEARIG